MKVKASFSADGQAFEVLQEREGLLDDVAALRSLPRPLMFGAPSRETTTGRMRRDFSSRRLGLLS